MVLKEIVNKLDLKVLAGAKAMDREVEGVYICDLLSWVMSHGKKDNIWITVLTHQNIIAVAMLTEVACILLPDGIVADELTIKKAEEEGVVVLSTEMSSYEFSWKTHAILQ